jgi:hypothetical protein
MGFEISAALSDDMFLDLGLRGIDRWNRGEKQTIADAESLLQLKY